MTGWPPTGQILGRKRPWRPYRWKMTSPPELPRYPRTRHLEGSLLPAGEHDPEQTPFAELAGRHLVIEEKLDGAGVGLCFDEGGELWLHHRGELLHGREDPHLRGLRSWAEAHEQRLLALLGDRYVLYGEWLQQKHTVFYDQLPHLFCEFDVYDRAEGVFLSTSARRELLVSAPFVCSVPELYEGDSLRSVEELTALLAPSLYKSERWRDALREAAASSGADVERVREQTDNSDFSEGLYVKVEENGEIAGRFKWVRHGFLTAIRDSGSHWASRSPVPNLLAPGIDIYVPALPGRTGR
jgi:hypothetical protein